MLKWKRNKCGGSHPEGLDRIDSVARAQSHRTLSLRETKVSSPRAIHRRNNDLFTRSFCEGDNTKSERISTTSLSDADIPSYLHQKRFNHSLSEPYNKQVSPSPFENISLEDICATFHKAHEEMVLSTPSPQEEGCSDIFIVAPTKSRQNSRQDRQCSPTALPCIEEGVENDELASIADSGICDDDEYEFTDKSKQKRYFEPLKFHDDHENGLLSSLNETSHKHSPDENNKKCILVSDDVDNNKNEIETKYKNEISQNYNTSDEYGLSSSRDSSSSMESCGSFDNSDGDDNCNDNLSGVDIKNNEIFSRTPSKADLTQGIHDDSVHHSLISSMLWDGNTSDQPPSSTGIYSTMPPNRYGQQRSKDFISQLSNYQDKNIASPKEFKVSLDVSHYGPDEILVTLEDGKLVVNGKHFSESEYGFECLQFHRRYPIPEGIKKGDIKSTITDDGVLIITGRVSLETNKINESYDNIPPDSSRLKRATSSTSSGRSTPVRPMTPEMALSGSQPNISSPTWSRRSLPTSDYSEDSRSRLSEDSNLSENEFQETEEDTFMLKVNCKGYDPQDLDLKIQSRELIVHGRQKVCSVEGGHERIRHKEFTKRFSVPRNANCHQIMSRFTEDEQLVVEIRKGGSSNKGVIREDILDDE